MRWRDQAEQGNPLWLRVEYNRVQDPAGVLATFAHNGVRETSKPGDRMHICRGDRVRDLLGSKGYMAL